MYTQLKSFRFWCNKVLPLVYDDSLSYYEVLAKLTEYINKMIENQDFMNNVLGEYGLTLEQVKSDVDFLKLEVERVKKGEYISLYLDSIKGYIDNNLQDMVKGIVQYVTFGLSDDGHFIAMIPEKWDFLEFDTILNMNEELYGHLIMKW